MLHLSTIDESVHHILLSLMEKDYLRDFALVGGTSLALRYGHRNSIDIDLFSPIKFNAEFLSMTLEIDYKNFDFSGSNKYMMFCYINQVKTDFVFHPYQLLKPIDVIDGIRMFSIEDVTAMKLQAVTQRGSKKDFYDIWQLLQIMTAKQLIDIYAAKYTESQVWMLLNSLIYFVDAEKQAQPKIFINKLSWDTVKKTIVKAFKNITL